MSAAYVCRYYGVPGRRGVRVQFEGQLHAVTSCRDAHVR